MAKHNPLREAIVIRRCDNLNKDNFWDIAMEICPITTKHFCEWIDRYKKNVHYLQSHNLSMDWDGLFHNDHHVPVKIKFHDIPLEMQVGIIFRFFYDSWQDYMEGVNILDPSAWVDIICILFNEREEKFKEKYAE